MSLEGAMKGDEDGLNTWLEGLSSSRSADTKPDDLDRSFGHVPTHFLVCEVLPCRLVQIPVLFRGYFPNYRKGIALESSDHLSCITSEGEFETNGQQLRVRRFGLEKSTTRVFSSSNFSKKPHE